MNGSEEVPKLRKWYEEATLPIGRLLEKTGLKPNHITLASIFPAILASYLFYKGKLYLGLLFFLLAILFDVLDGSLARASGSKTRIGMLIDHYTDRTVEFLAVLGLTSGGYVPGWLGLLTFFSMISPSYIRARGEAIYGKSAMMVGIMERKEKLTLIFLGVIFQRFKPWSLTLSFLVISTLSLITAVWRIVFFARLERNI